MDILNETEQRQSMADSHFKNDLIHEERAKPLSENSSVIALAIDLINRKSVTPCDGGCNELLIARLEAIGFRVERMNHQGVSNFWAIRGNGQPAVVFSGHTDVVPAGKGSRWNSDPFCAEIRDGYLYGRGAADMKGGLAAMVVAVEQFVTENSKHKGAIGFMITSDEEGDAEHGTAHIIQQLNERGTRIDYAVVGEPTSSDALADSIRIGRRGSINCTIRISGKQGHVGYPEQLNNPIHAASKLIHKISHKRWDLPSRFFPSTSFQLVKLESNSGAMNVTPACLEAVFNLRYSPRSSFTSIKKYVEKKIKKYGLDAEVEWFHEAQPYLTKRGKLRKVVQQTIESEYGYKPKLTTAGGISDGRFIKTIARQVIELGPSNATIHQANERVSIQELEALPNIYSKLLEQLLC